MTAPDFTARQRELRVWFYMLGLGVVGFIAVCIWSVLA